jgi:NAD-dependent SIR2 family protein deacetylase
MFQAAADVIRQAHALIITAGAGMGVDSGLPDFRGTSGFWQAYPPYAKRGLSFAEAANPLHFQRDPSFGWGFYGHRCNLYRSTTPHEGFHILQRWIRRTNAGHFIVTSNVDGQFQKAGFDESDILEVHGSIHHLQCLEPCHDSIWPNDQIFDIDTQAMRSRSIPRCPRCGSVSRPNILMFGAAGGRRPLRAPDQALEPEDEAVHLRARNGIYIIDLQQSVCRSSTAPTSSSRRRSPTASSVLFVGTKKQAQDAVSPSRPRAAACTTSTSAGWAGCSPTSRP